MSLLHDLFGVTKPVITMKESAITWNPMALRRALRFVAAARQAREQEAGRG